MFGWFSRKSTPVAVPPAGIPPRAAAPAPRKLTEVSGVVYPPQDPGIPVAPVASLLQDQADLIGMLKMHAAQPGSQFDTRLLGPIERIAAIVNVLPGSANGVFSGAGGLFRATMEGAFGIFRASDGRIFTGDKGVEERHALEIRWRYVCFLAGLLYPVGRSLESLNVVDASGAKWAPELEGLTEWCEQRSCDRVYATWARPGAEPGPSSLPGTFALKVVGRENVEWLNAGSATLVQALMDIVTGSPATKTHKAGVLVAEVWALVREREAARLPQHYGQLTVGSDVSPYLLDAVVTLFKERWQVNKSVAYADNSAIYLEWPKAAEDMVQFCRDRGYAGIPASDGALLAMMASTKIIHSEGEVSLEEIANVDGEIVLAVRLKRPGLVLRPDQSLAEIASSRPIKIADVRAADTLVARPAARAATATPESKARPAPQLTAMAADEVAATAGDDDGTDDEPPVDQSSVQAQVAEAQQLAPPSPAVPVPEAAAPAVASAKAVEGREIKYRDLLSKEVADSLPALTREHLGQLVYIFRNRANGQAVMRFCEHGLAMDTILAKTVATDVPRFLGALAEKGLLYTADATPRKLTYKVAVTEGAQATRDCFILAHHTARKLGLS